MGSSSNQFDTISTVHLTPFAEDQWHRIVTYSPIYGHWTDVVLGNPNQQQQAQQQQQQPQQRPPSQARPASRRLNSREMINIETLKLEDELLLNQLNRIKEAANITRMKREQAKLQQSVSKKSSETEFDQNSRSFVEEQHGFSSAIFSMQDEIPNYKKFSSGQFLDTTGSLMASSRQPTSSNRVSEYDFQ